MRLGIFLGFLIGAAIASLIAREAAEAPAEAGTESGGGFFSKLKRQAQEARTAAREASEQKQAEMLRDWERARHHGNDN